MAEKIDRKQLRRPDEFQVVAGKAMEWVAGRQRQVVVAVGALVLVVLLAWGFGIWRSSREAAAGADLAQALEILSRPIAGEAPAQPGQETFASKEERTKAALVALEKVRADHGSTTAAQTALAEFGFMKLRSGDAAGSQKDLSDFLSNASREHPLRVFAQESLGYAWEAQGKLDDARGAFDKLRELGLPARADLQAARLALVQGKPDAKQQLERIVAEYPKELDVVREANQRLELAALPPVPAGYVAPAPPAGAEKPAEPTTAKPAASAKKAASAPAKKPPPKKKK